MKTKRLTFLQAIGAVPVVPVDDDEEPAIYALLEGDRPPSNEYADLRALFEEIRALKSQNGHLSSEISDVRRQVATLLTSPKASSDTGGKLPTEEVWRPGPHFEQPDEIEVEGPSQMVHEEHAKYATTEAPKTASLDSLEEAMNKAKSLLSSSGTAHDELRRTLLVAEGLLHNARSTAGLLQPSNAHLERAIQNALMFVQAAADELYDLSPSAARQKAHEKIVVSNVKTGITGAREVQSKRQP